ncbi:phosphohistidine phosphatase SixA [Aestuariibacter halophilus]|uniref:Phosphohistidine phosphatase SixA n=1 Tax=Fluctibacter halophilus TaxID=226011 RepID=A0ABS8G3R7_9ALTE|nr:phosphohistidine phosphatase SixA [Aestuariibacter halophilus]MCC2615175.1 phosphohistidine phosphatase SixA [Aestuariibacter halophilus]
MHIYIMRHGDAEPSFENDQGRQLTEWGQHQACQGGRWLKRQLREGNSALSLALVSPYTRAQETYQQLTRHVQAVEVQSCVDLVPGADPRTTHDFLDTVLADLDTNAHVLLVSHLPLVSYLLDELCHQHVSLLFGTGDIAVVEYDLDKGRGTWRETYSPE